MPLLEVWEWDRECPNGLNFRLGLEPESLRGCCGGGGDDGSVVAIIDPLLSGLSTIFIVDRVVFDALGLPNEWCILLPRWGVSNECFMILNCQKSKSQNKTQ